ncbi:MAG: thiamine pyrophosphate-binding protein [Pseudomonadota bacterium]
MKIKLSDYVADKLVEFGCKHVFMVTGGGAMHLNQSLGTNNKMKCIFNHHEQACAMAAESYSRLTNRLAVVNVTTGPGSTNAITGVHGAWTDSISMMIISGQVKRETTISSTGLPLRQYGDQEINICKVVDSITKYSHMVIDPSSIKYHLEKAFYLAISGRPGPCWLDIPIDVQSSIIETDSLKGFNPQELEVHYVSTDERREKAIAVLHKIEQAHSPVIFVGSGVRLSGAHEKFIQLINKLNIPVVTGWNAHDALWDDHPCYVGRPGSVGDRAGNFVVQNADLLLILGSRLNIRQVSYNWQSFAAKAYKIWIDIDELEMKKPTVSADMIIHDDLADFIPALITEEYCYSGKSHENWLIWCQQRRQQYPVVLAEYWHNEKINPYCFIERLFDQLPEGQIIVSANGSACVVGFQAAKLKRNQRFWSNSGCASMGYDLPAAIGACIGSGNEPIVCLAGDGSIMMNLQELQTIVGQNLPIKIFLFNNQGYSSIFQTQKNFFNGSEVGASPASGVSFPDFEQLSQGFGIFYLKAKTHQELTEVIRQTMKLSGPILCEVFLDENQPFAPKLSSKQLDNGSIVSPSIDDMSPFLSAEEMAKNIYLDH